jgi:Right handed beta helix region/Periplasmic copper-binding protein (NosD)
MRLTTLPGLALLATIALPMLAPPAAAVDPGSELITCDRADERVDIRVSSHLDPSCTWTRGFEILASNVTFDCQGARIAAPDRRYGVYIHAPADTPLTNITVRNCHIEGFLNNFHIEREGFRQLAEGVEYENGFSNITIEDSTSLNSRGVGIFVNGYVEGVTLRNLHVEGASSTGIYLEAGSKNCVVENSTIINNGFGENSPQGGTFTFGGVDFWFWGTGREGLAIDGSRFNIVRNNSFQSNIAGGIFLYKNCGEFVTQRPERWFHRRYGADGNVIENNVFINEDNGVWIGSRMAENTAPMECSDPQYAAGYSLDYADDNVVRDNVFQNVTFGVRVEDDDAVVTDNEFVSADAIDEAIVVGTRYRTEILAQSVDGTVITGNTASIAGSPNPYRWIWGHTNTTFSNNQSLGEVVSLCEGVQPPVGPFVMTVAFEVLEDPENPPNEIRELPLPGVLPPCATACEAGGSVSKPSLSVKKLDTPPGDDTLTFKGELVLPHPFAPTLDPVANGIAVMIEDSAGIRTLDVTVPGGAYDRVTKVGWEAARSGTSWKYVDKTTTPPGGITALSIKDMSRKQPGLLKVKVTGKRGSYPVDTASLPLTGLLILDPPTAASGQCGVATFVGLNQSCTTDGKGVKCK